MMLCFIATIKNSPLYVCSLDAEKCFDSIWRPALFYKLKDKMSHTFWLFLVKWYKALRAVVKWKGQYSHIFTVTRVTRQGSILSPQLFNICIDDLLQSLQHVEKSVSIGYSNYSSFAYADDVTVYSSTIPDLQFLIQMCADYAQKWRFRSPTFARIIKDRGCLQAITESVDAW